MTFCDIGNSTFAFYNGHKSFKYSLDDSLEALQKDEPIYYISVNQKAEQKFNNYFQNTTNLKEYLPLKTNYSDTLGIDRVLGCIAFEDAIIVDFGSAITLDIMKDSFHSGGFIMPGIKKLQALYPQISSKLAFEYNKDIDLSTLPQNTNDAISFAIDSMIVEPIKKVQEQYNLPLYITGEDGEDFVQYFTNVQYNPTLLFDNMKLVIQRNNI